MSWQQRTLELAVELCSRASITPNNQGCLELIEARLKPLGFDCRRLQYDQVDNLFATYTNLQTPHLLLLGHVDVVPTGDAKQWLFDPFKPTIHNHKLYARGIADMKGAVACFSVAIERFLSDNPHFNGSLSVLLTTDEEGPAVNGVKRLVVDYLQPKGITFDYCLVCEPSSDKKAGDTIKIGRRGSLSANLTIRGKQGHVAYPQNAINPIHLAASLVTKLNQHIWDEGNQDFPATTLQCSNIQAGTGVTNIIPDSLKLDFNVRYGNLQTPQKLQQQIKNLLHQQQLNYAIDWQHSANPYLSCRDSLLVKTCQSVAKRIFHLQPHLSTAGGTSDGRFIAPMGVQTIEFGPLNESIHQINENLSLQELQQFTQAYYQILCELFNCPIQPS